jgi:hypothetical protein
MSLPTELRTARTTARHVRVARTLLALLLGLTATVTSAQEENDKLSIARITIAERFIDAFYAFDPEPLRQILGAADDTQQTILFYQGWARGANYKVLKRAPCVADGEAQISCSITVEDDPVLALKSDFKVTDTFTLSFAGESITHVETSSNDQPIYYEAYDWVTENMPEVMTGPCQGFFKDGPTPAACARAMTEGYRRFAESEDFPG